MHLRVYVEDLEDDRRQSVVGYVKEGEHGRVVNVAVQTDAPDQRRAAAQALVDVGRQALDEIEHEAAVAA